MCWSADVAAAERFAEEYRVMDGGSVLLETVAPLEAIISAVAYSPPSTQEEIAELRAHPGVKMEQPTEYHEEREYIIDRRLLHGVNVTRRFDALPGPPGLRLRGSGPDRDQGPSGAAWAALA
jgi:hypothetical protein